MCMATEWLLIEREGLLGIGERAGIRRRFSLMMLPSAQVGEIVLVHAGFAMAKKISPSQEDGLSGVANRLDDSRIYQGGVQCPLG